MPVRGSINIWYKVYGCTQVQVRPSKEVSGKIFVTELSLHRDVHVRLAVTQPWTPHVATRQL